MNKPTMKMWAAPQLRHLASMSATESGGSTLSNEFTVTCANFTTYSPSGGGGG